MDECSICLLPLGEDLHSLECRHAFCSPCITKWLDLKSTCPMCGFEVPNLRTQPPKEQILFSFSENKAQILKKLDSTNTTLTAMKKQSKKIKGTISKSDIFMLQQSYCEIEDLFLSLCSTSIQKQNIMETVLLIEQINLRLFELQDSLHILNPSPLKPAPRLSKKHQKQQKLSVRDFDEDFPELAAL